MGQWVDTVLMQRGLGDGVSVEGAFEFAGNMAG